MRPMKRQIVMKLKQVCLILLNACFLTAYSNIQGQNAIYSAGTSSDSLQIKSGIDRFIQKTITLDNGFEIKVGKKEDFKEFETYALLILTHNSKQLYLDTCLAEYKFADNLYPIVRQLDEETFEILVEVNDRPSKNYLLYFKVRQDKVVSTERLPTFISKASNLDTDDNLEFAGFWDWGETWGENGSLTAYNPLIYYELKPSGLSLDSTLTILKNKEIYGNFYGFEYNEKIEIRTSQTIKLDKEISRINGIK